MKTDEAKIDLVNLELCYKICQKKVACDMLTSGLACNKEDMSMKRLVTDI